MNQFYNSLFITLPPLGKNTYTSVQNHKNSKELDFVKILFYLTTVLNSRECITPTVQIRVKMINNIINLRVTCV
jgi:hypothetical protein